PQPLLAWLRATGQRLPPGQRLPRRRTVLDDQTEITAYCDPLRGVNAAAGARDQLRLGAGAPLPTAGLRRSDAGLALLPHLRRASPPFPAPPPLPFTPSPPSFPLAQHP